MIDLHTHSNRSDGLDTPTELVEKAAACGISVLAITDHDTTSGWDEAISAARREGIGLVPGIEVSTRSEIGNGRRISVHILAYLPNPEHPELVSELAKTRDSRVTRARKMVDLLSGDYEISWQTLRPRWNRGQLWGGR